MYSICSRHCPQGFQPTHTPSSIVAEHKGERIRDIIGLIRSVGKKRGERFAAGS